jgi:transposase
LVKEVQREEGIEGLKDRTKSGRPLDISEETIYEIKNELASSKQGWTTKQVEDLIVRKRVVESDIIILTYVAFYTSGDSNRRYQNRYM